MNYSRIIDDEGNVKFPYLGCHIKILPVASWACLSGMQMKMAVSEARPTIGTLKGLTGIGKDDKGRPLVVEFVIETAEGNSVTIEREGNIESLKSVYVGTEEAP